MKNKIINYISGSNALRLDNNIYSIISDNYNKTKNTMKNSPMISMQSNIFRIQQIYLDLIENDDINILGINLKFTDDIWDFSSLRKDGKPDSIYTFYFNGNSIDLSIYSKNILKLFVMYLITEYGLYRSSNKNEYLNTFKFLNIWRIIIFYQ